MDVFVSEAHTLHCPEYELFEGGRRLAYFEVAERVERIVKLMGTRPDRFVFRPSDDWGMEPLLAVHNADYLEFLRTAYDDWLRDGASRDGQSTLTLLPAVFPPGGMRRRPTASSSIQGRVGYYVADLSAAICAGTYAAAVAAAHATLSAARAVIQAPAGERAGALACALVRPPGHHAGPDFAAGYCFINNAAVAAAWMRAELGAAGRVAVIDIDNHAGNGTQAIFYSRADVLTISIHATPEVDYPYHAGFADETGEGAGAGYHVNCPLPVDTTDEGYFPVLATVLDRVRAYAPHAIVVSAGMDLFEGDPVGRLAISAEGIVRLGTELGALEAPMLVVLEGGYNNDELAANFVGFLDGLFSARPRSV